MWALAGYVTLFFWLGFRRYNACAVQSGDTAIFECAFYNTLKGNFFWCFGSASSYFESHTEPLLLLYVPLYAIAPSTEMLIFLQTLCIAVSSVPVFLLGRKLLRRDAGAIAMSCALLFFPSLVSQNVGQVHTIAFALPFLTFAFYFFVEERFWPFVVTVALACLGKESMAMTAAMFGPYALLKRRHLRWAITGFAIPVGLLVLNLKVIRPQFASGHEYFALQYFPGMGNSLGEFAKTVITRPDIVFDRLFTVRNTLYLALLLGAVAYVLPFLTVEAIFLAPELFINLLSSNDGMKTVIYLYNGEVGVFLVIAALFGIAKLEKRWQARLGAGQYGIILAGCVALMSVSNWWQWFSPGEYIYNATHDSRQRAIKLIPPDDSLVAGPGQLLAHVGHRKLLVDPKMIAMNPDQMFNYNWVLFDMNYQRPILGEFVPRDQLMAYGTNSNYEVVFAENNVYVMRRKTRVPPEKVTPIRYTSDEPLLRKMQGGGQ